ncbi:MAG: SIMPL domain-containing protein [Candidatus Nanoarchaeia archaeon]
MKEKTYTTPLLIILGLAVVILAIVLAFPEEITINSGGVPEKNTLNVQGEYTLTVAPDEAEVYIVVETEDATVRQAQKDNALLVDQVMSALKNAGVAEDEMETSSFNIYPQRKWDPDSREYEDTGYKASHIIKVTTSKIESVGDYIDAATNNGATGINRIQFKLSEETEKDAKEQALSRAAQEAKSKAEAITAGLGSRVGDIVQISESNVYYRGWDYPAPMMAMAEDAEGAAVLKETDIAPSSIDVSARINVLYEIK